jgi:hypothetical protein
VLVSFAALPIALPPKGAADTPAVPASPIPAAAITANSVPRIRSLLSRFARPDRNPDVSRKVVTIAALPEAYLDAKVCRGELNDAVFVASQSTSLIRGGSRKSSPVMA